MTRRLTVFIAAALLLVAVVASAAPVALDQRVAEVNHAIIEQGATWRAGRSFVAEMPMDEFVAMLGADMNAPRGAAPRWTPKQSVALPAHFDWRDVQGQNFVTPVKYQGRCGSCVAFGCIGAIEAGIRIREENPNLDVDLSEQHAFACAGMSGCDYGTNATTLLSGVRVRGVVDEDCYPYMSGGTGMDYTCNATCGDAASRAFKIAGYSSIWGGVSAIKQAMLQSGPVAATFYVYEDLKYYIDGVYQHVFGPYLGGHQVLLVGWDDATESWIAKNSWSESFGEDGFFNIKWNSCGISDDVTKVDVGTQAYTPGGPLDGNCGALANHLYNTCNLGYEVGGQSLDGEAFLDYCQTEGVPSCAHSCHESHTACNELAGCIGFCTDQWCAMDFNYLYDTCGLAVVLEAGNPMSKEAAIDLCERVGYNSNAMKCILECIPQTSTCQQLTACMIECPLCTFPTVELAADVTESETAPLTVNFTATVAYPEDCGPTVTHWDFGDGATSYDPGTAMSHTYTTEGDFVVELRVTNAAGPGIVRLDPIHIGPAATDDDTADDDVADDDAADDDAVDDDTEDDAGDDDDDTGSGDDDDDDDDDDDSGCGC